MSDASPGVLVLMGRHPVPGTTKTRLIPALGAEGAAAFARAALEDLAERLVAIPARRHVLALAGQPDAAPLDLPRGLEILPQGEGDLGERMLRIYRRFGAPLVFVGADCPTLPPAGIRRAFAWLDDDVDAVFQPASDGGYCLAGFRVDPAPWFEGIPWGSEEVLTETLRRTDSLPYRLRLLDPWYDVDRPGDLEHLRLHLPALRASASWPPRTAALIQSRTRTQEA